MYAFSPFINKALWALNKKQHATLVWFLVLILTFPFLNGVLGVKGGYGLLWFIALYVVGAYLREYGVPKFLNM